MSARCWAADRAAELAEQGWRDYCAPAPGRYAGLTTAVTVGRGIPALLRELRAIAPGWDEWWDAHSGLHDTVEGARLGRLRAGFEHPGPLPAVHEDHLDAAFSRDLGAMRVLTAAARERYAPTEAH